MGVSETHWTWQGKVQLAEGETIRKCRRARKREVYTRLQDVLDSMNTHDILIVTEDGKEKYVSGLT